MPKKLVWDAVGKRTYETGVDHAVLYPMNKQTLAYDKGYAWSGVTQVAENPSGADSTALYADNIKYLNLVSAEEFGFTIDAYTYPPEWEACDGTAEIAPGVTIGQQNRDVFGLSYRTKVGDDVNGQDKGYKLHLIYGAQAAPSGRNYQTVNDNPEAITFSWECKTTQVNVTGFKPTASIVIDSTLVDAAKLAELETILYGSDEADARLPMPDEIQTLFATAA